MLSQLRIRNFALIDEVDLEFGAGQSTLWWGKRAARVVAFEGDADWFKQLKPRVGDNVRLLPVSMDSAEACAARISECWVDGGSGSSPYCRIRPRGDIEVLMSAVASSPAHEGRTLRRARQR